MLTDEIVIKYVKRNLGFPTVTIELDDDTIRDIIFMQTIPEFSKWAPDIATTKIITTDPLYKVENRSNAFYFYDKDNRDIIEPTNVYYDRSVYMLTGIPAITPYLTYDALDDAMVQMMRGETTYEYAGLHMAWKFFHPNVIELHTMHYIPNTLLVRYKRFHATDFSTIPAPLQTLFLQLALADVKIAIGEQRSKYTNYSTTMGEIPINTDIKNEGNELRDKVIEELQTIPFPVPLVVD